MFQVQDLVPSYCEQSPGMGPVQDWGPKLALGISQPLEKDLDGTYHLVCLKGWTSTKLLERNSRQLCVQNDQGKIIIKEKKINAIIHLTHDIDPNMYFIQFEIIGFVCVVQNCCAVSPDAKCLE